MRTSHAPVHITPLLARMDRHFGGAWSKQDIDDRARDWARHLAAAPLPAIEAAVDCLIETHEGNYPRLALVRRIALEQTRHFRRPLDAPDDRCPTCGEEPGWHPVARPRLPAVKPYRWPTEYMADTVTRCVIRHRADRPCHYLNAAHHFADGTAPEESP